MAMPTSSLLPDPSSPYPHPVIMGAADPLIEVVVGPTASGKSAYAIELATRVGGEVVVADSRQVYRGFPTLTAKVLPEEMAGIPHHMMDLVEIEEVYTAGRYATDALAVVHAILARGKRPIVAGGTFFYVEALLWDGYLPASVPPNPSFRATLAAHTTEALLSQLATHDPERARAIGLNRPRLIRALEIIHARGAIPRRTNLSLRWPIRVHYLSWPREVLAQRIAARVAGRVDAMAEEVRDALERLTADRARRLGFDWTLPLAYLKGTMSRAALIEALSHADLRYARRQERWWRHSLLRRTLEHQHA